MGAEVIRQHLKSGLFARLYVLYGSEAYLKSFYCQKICEKAVNSMESFNVQHFDSGNFSLSRFEAALNNLPLMSDKKCIILRDISPDSLKADEWKEFQQVLKDLPDYCVLIIHFNTVEYDKKSSRWKTLLQTAQKIGVAADVESVPKNELEKWVNRQAAKHFCFFDPEDAEYLIGSCGSDMNQLKNEINKLCAFKKNEKITRNDIEALTPKTSDASIYDLSKAVTAGNLIRALRILDELFYKREEPVMILSTLSGAFCDLYRAKTATLGGLSQTAIESDFRYKGREFRIKNAIRDSRKLDPVFLRTCLSLLMKADKQLKTTRTEKRVILERLVVEIDRERRKADVS